MKNFFVYINMIHIFFITIIWNDKRNLNQKKKTALHIALENSSIEIAELLISKGADINAIDIIYLNLITLFLIKLF